MKLKKEFIGVTFKFRDMPPVTIEDNPELFDFYKYLGLDIFIKEKKKSDKTNEGNNEQ